MQDKVILLDHHHFFSVSGPDATHFLQGLVTQNIQKVTQSTPQYSCFLTPQGKFLYDFFIHIDTENKYLIEIHQKFLDDFIKKLSFYKLRASVEIKKIDLNLYWSDKSRDTKICYQDPRRSDLGYRLIGDFKARSGEVEYRKMMLQKNIPYGAYDLIQDKTFILEAGFDELNAVDFNKGCYIGQELTARMHHTTELRKKLFALEFETEIEAEERAPILNEKGEKIGELYSYIEHLGFSMIRLENLPDSGITFVNGNKGRLYD